MRHHPMQSDRTIAGSQSQIGDIPGGTTSGAIVERSRPASPRPIDARPCDGCGQPDPAVDLWAEDTETGEQLWLCLACGGW